MMTPQTFDRPAIAVRPRRTPLPGLVGEWLHNWRSRRVLSRMTPEQLRDVGLTIDEALQEASLPFWVGQR